MHKTIVVALREYRSAVKTKAFLLGLIMMPIMFGGAIIVQALLRNNADTSDKRVAIADYTGQLFEAAAAAAKARNDNFIYAGEGSERKQIQPRYVLEKVDPGANDSVRMSLALSERVRKKDILAFVIIEPGALQPGENAGRGAINYYSESPTYNQIQQWIAGPLNERIQFLRLQAANLDPIVVREATRRVAVGNLGLVKVDAAGNPIMAAETNMLANIFVPIGLMMLMFMVVMGTATPLMNTVLEEKMQRIAEVLMGSVPPFQLMLGKLLGTVGVSLTIAAVYLLGAFAALERTGYSQYFPWHLLSWFMVFQTLAVLMFGSIFVAIGAAVTDLKEAQSMMTPVMLLMMAPMFVWFNVVSEPNSSIALTMSLFPTATPMLMLVRQAVPPGIPLWQPMVGIVVVLCTTGLCIFAAGRIFRVGILMQGKGAKISELARWAFRG
jgi:ABC-2 type transport system permease protein